MNPTEVHEKFEDLMKRHGLKWKDIPRLQIHPKWLPVAEEAIIKMLKAGWDGELHGIGRKLGGMRIYTGKSNHKLDSITSEAFVESFRAATF
jgi:hypothetical protein